MLLPALPLEAVTADHSLAKRYGVVGAVVLQPSAAELPLPQEYVPGARHVDAWPETHLCQ